MKEELKLLKQIYMGINLQIREITELPRPQAERQVDKILTVLEELYEYHSRLLIEYNKGKASKNRSAQVEDRNQQHEEA